MSTNRHRYLVSYDISDDKRRTSVFNLLRDRGDHAQYSVFLCELTSRELTELKTQLTDRIHHEEDQIIVLDLGKASSPLDLSLECIGRGFTPAKKVLVV